MTAPRIAIFFGLTVVLLTGCSSPAKKDVKQEVTQQWKDARAGVQFAMAKQQYEAGSLPAARKSIDSAIALSPNNLSSLLLSARVHIEQGELAEAETDLNRASILNDTVGEIDYLHGVVAQRWQRNDAALAHYHLAATKAPTELAYVLAEGETLVSLGRTDEALTLLQNKVVYFEHSAAIRDAVGQLLVQAGRHAEAIDMLRRGAALAPDEWIVREHLALALYYGSEYREAADVLNRLLIQKQYLDRADLHTALGECYLQLNRPREARASFDRATQLEPSSATLWVRLGKSAVAVDDLRRADLSIRKALSLDPTLAEAHLLSGYVKLKQNRLADAIESFNQASALDRRDTVALCMIGYVLEKLDRPAQAIEYYSKALQLRPADDLATRLLAGVEMN